MDKELFLLINRDWTASGLDWFMAAISSWGVLIVPVLLLVLGMLLFGGFRARAAVIVAGLAVAVADGLIANTLKDAVGRPRPNQVMARVRIVDLKDDVSPRQLALFQPAEVEMSRPQIGTVRGGSFPSSHTMNNFTVAAVLLCFFPRTGWLYLIAAICIGYSRIYTGSHWPTDVLVSIPMGMGTGILVYLAAELFWRRTGSRLFPRFHQKHPSLAR